MHSHIPIRKAQLKLFHWPQPLCQDISLNSINRRAPNLPTSSDRPGQKGSALLFVIQGRNLADCTRELAAFAKSCDQSTQTRERHSSPSLEMITLQSECTASPRAFTWFLNLQIKTPSWPNRTTKGMQNKSPLPNPRSSLRDEEASFKQQSSFVMFFK